MIRYLTNFLLHAQITSECFKEPPQDYLSWITQCLGYKGYNDIFTNHQFSSRYQSYYYLSPNDPVDNRSCGDILFLSNIQYICVFFLVLFGYNIASHLCYIYLTPLHQLIIKKNTIFKLLLFWSCRDTKWIT